MLLAEEQPEFVLGGLKACTLLRRELTTGAIDVKIKHGHRRAKWIGLAALAEFFSDSAICLGSCQVNTPGSRSKALLVGDMLQPACLVRVMGSHFGK